MARRTLANTEGVQLMPWGIRAYVKVNGHQTQKTFAHGTPLEEIIAWRRETAQELSQANPAVARGSFAADVKRFLAAMTGRRRESFEGELKHWVERLKLKDRPRHTITRQQILAGLAKMQARGLAACLTLGGLAFVTRNVALVLAPAYASGSVLLLMLPGGLSLTVWLLVRGADVPKWEEKTALAAYRSLPR